MRCDTGRPRRGGRWVGLVLAAAALLSGCAGVVPPGAAGRAGPVEPGQVIELDGRPYAARWVLPAGPPSALVVLAHGFTRRCAHLQGSTQQLAQAGLMSLCLDASMAGGGTPALAEALAQRLLDGTDPAGRPWPTRLIVAGHSAGAVFALRLGVHLAEKAPVRLAGALLFDPVATADFGAALIQVSDAGRRPVLALLAAPHRCNAQGNALAPLREAQQQAQAAGRDTLQVTSLGPGSTHADVEGENSDWLAITACGRPDPDKVAELRSLAVGWARQVAEGPVAAAAATPALSPAWPNWAPKLPTHATMPPCPTCVN